MRNPTVAVFSCDIDVNLVFSHIRDHGIVVLSTTRPHAHELCETVRERLGVRGDSDDAPYILHLAFQVEDDFEHCLMYSAVADLHPDKLKALVTQAVNDRHKAGSPDCYVWTEKK